MLIDSHDLIRLLRGSAYGALPRERQHIETVIDTIAQCNIVARLDSERSTSLRKLIEKHIDYLEPESARRMMEIDIYGAEIPIADAIARVEGERQQVIVFDGLLQLIRMYGDLMAVITLLTLLRRGKTVLIDGISTPEDEAYAEAGFAIMADYVQTGNVAVEFRSILGAQARNRVDIGYEAAVLFVLAHEVGHLYLNHVGVGLALNSERAAAALAIQESLSPQQRRELDADAFAVDSIRANVRHFFFPSMLMFLGTFSFIEALGRPASSTHPLSANRTAQLASMLTPNPSYSAVFNQIVENRIATLSALVPYRRQAANGSIRDKIRDYYITTDRAQLIVDKIKTAIEADLQFLDDTELSDLARKEMLRDTSGQKI